MVNYKLLSEKICESGITKKALAYKVGISRESLYKKLNGETAFTVPEMNNLSEALHLDNSTRIRIFFAQNVG